MADIVEVYKKYNNDFEKAVEESGLPPFIAFIKLARAGVVTINDKIKFGTTAQKLGAMAEEEFQKLVPEAINYNDVVKINNEFFDFKYKDVTIDVKYSSLHKRGNYSYWNFRANTTADLFVCFLEKEKGKNLNDSYLFVVPQTFAGKGSITVTKDSYFFKGFCVERTELKNILNAYQELKEETGIVDEI